MKAIIALTIFLAVCSASTVSQREIDNLMQSNWGKIFLNMAQLQIQAGGPIEDLVREIENLSTADQVKLDQATDAFDRRTAEHDETVRQLNGKINDAQASIANTQKLIAETLIPQKNAMEEGIVQARNTIKSNNDYIAEATASRNAAQVEYEGKMKQANEVAAAIDEALAVLAKLSEDDTSLIQLKAAQKTLKKVTEKLQRGGSESWIEALVQLASTNYANTDAIQKVEKLLNDIRQNTLDHIENETAANNKAIETFKAEVANRIGQNRQAEADIIDYSNKLTQTIEAIKSAEQLIVNLKSDLKGYQDQLAEENTAYERATKSYEDLKAQLEAEMKACGEAADVLRKGVQGMADYIKQRTDEGITPLTEAHGQKMNVFDYTYSQ